MTANEHVHLKAHSWNSESYHAGKAVWVLEGRARCVRGPTDSSGRPDSKDLSCGIPQASEVEITASLWLALQESSHSRPSSAAQLPMVKICPCGEAAAGLS